MKIKVNLLLRVIGLFSVLMIVCFIIFYNYKKNIETLFASQKIINISSIIESEIDSHYTAFRSSLLNIKQYEEDIYYALYQEDQSEEEFKKHKDRYNKLLLNMTNSYSKDLLEGFSILNRSGVLLLSSDVSWISLDLSFRNYYKYIMNGEYNLYYSLPAISVTTYKRIFTTVSLALKKDGKVYGVICIFIYIDSFLDNIYNFFKKKLIYIY